MHYIVDVPEILSNIKKDHPEISYEISEPLGTHDYMVDLVENVFKMLKFLPPLIMRLY